MKNNKILENGSANNLGEMNRVFNESEQQNSSRDFGFAEGVNNRIYSVLDLNLPWIERGTEFDIDWENDIVDVIKDCEPRGAQIWDEGGCEILTGVMNVLKSKLGKDKYNVYGIDEWESNNNHTRLDIRIGDQYVSKKSATFVFTGLGLNGDYEDDYKEWWENLEECAENYYPKYNQYCYGLSEVGDTYPSFQFGEELKRRLIDIALYEAQIWVEAHYFCMCPEVRAGRTELMLTEEPLSFYLDFDELPDISITIFTD